MPATTTLAPPASPTTTLAPPASPTRLYATASRQSGSTTQTAVSSGSDTLPSPPLATLPAAGPSTSAGASRSATPRAPGAPTRVASGTGSPAGSPSPRSRTRALGGAGLGFAGIAALFIRARRARRRLALASTSGAPQTHPALAAAEARARVPLTRAAVTYVCAGGVDVQRLLRATRDGLLRDAQKIGRGVLVDERWTCTIREQFRPDGTYRVQVEYEAAAAQSDVPDPRRPVSLDQAKGVPGLMSVLEREE